MGHTYLATGLTTIEQVIMMFEQVLTGVFSPSEIYFTPLKSPISVSGPNEDYVYYLLESTSEIDSFVADNPDQTYRLLCVTRISKTNPFPVIGYRIHFGNADQLRFNQSETNVIIDTSAPAIDIISNTNRPYIGGEGNLRLTVTSRGFAAAYWRTTAANVNTANTAFTIQRPVNPTTGETKVTGNAPIFALWHDTGTNGSALEYAVVRELDRSASMYIGTTTAVSRYNMYKMTLDWVTPNLFSNNSHVVKFPYGFATSRHLYLDELDLMCFVSASAFASNQTLGITMYGEEEERKYNTTWGEVLYGNILGVQTPQPKIISGARVGILTIGGGAADPE